MWGAVTFWKSKTYFLWSLRYCSAIYVKFMMLKNLKTACSKNWLSMLILKILFFSNKMHPNKSSMKYWLFPKNFCWVVFFTKVNLHFWNQHTVNYKFVSVNIQTNFDIRRVVCVYALQGYNFFFYSFFGIYWSVVTMIKRFEILQ